MVVLNRLVVPYAIYFPRDCVSGKWWGCHTELSYHVRAMLTGFFLLGLWIWGHFLSKGRLAEVRTVFAMGRTHLRPLSHPKRTLFSLCLSPPPFLSPPHELLQG